MIDVQSAGGIATLAISDPATRNALGSRMLSALRAEVTAASAEATVRLLVLTHHGEIFSSGSDLREAGQTGADGSGLARVVEAIEQAKQPVIALARGSAYGGALALIAAADLSLVAVEATLQFSEVRFGLVPTLAAALCAPRLGVTVSRELMLMGEPITGERAAQVGLVNWAVPRAELDDAVARLQNTLLLGGPGALSVVKTFLGELRDLDHGAALRRGLELTVELNGTPEAAEGMAAFLGKRRPVWASTVSSAREEIG